LSLRAPIAVPVEIRASSRRVFRLAWNVGEDGLRLERGAPFEAGAPVEVRFGLPGDEALSLRAEVASGDQGDDQLSFELAFVDPGTEARIALRRYVHQRLGLPA
jgi:hypothetical protein